MRFSGFRSRLVFLGLGVGLIAAGGCDAGTGGVFSVGGADSTSNSVTGDASSSSGLGGGGPVTNSSAAQFMTGDASSGTGVMCAATPDEDFDQDGWSITRRRLQRLRQERQPGRARGEDHRS